MVSTPTPVCDFGWPAADFDLSGNDGRRHSLATARGPQGLLVMFLCCHCPYVQAILPRLLQEVRELTSLGIGCIALMSNDPTDHPEDSWENICQWARALDFPFPCAHDDTQDIARRYGAVCTPDFFGFNHRLELQYRGRFDATGRQAAPANPPAARELLAAMTLIAATGKGPAQQIPGIGCSIKWRKT